jgi:hypothetical protein
MPLKGDPSENDRKTAKLFSKIPRRGGVGFIKKKFFRKYKMINKFILDLRPSRAPDHPPNLRPSTGPKIFHPAAAHK